MPARKRLRKQRGTDYWTCPSCGLEARFTKNTVTVKKKKSAARVRAGRRRAAQNIRDARGRFVSARTSRARETVFFDEEGEEDRSSRRRIL